MIHKTIEPNGSIDLEGGWDQVVPGGPGGPIYRRGGQLHRLNGPAVVWLDGTKLWYVDGQLHRDGGPAVTHPSGSTEFWEHGQRTDPEPAAPVIFNDDEDDVPAE